MPHTRRLRPPTLCILTAALLPGKALAHDSSRDWTTAAPWTFEPWVLACLAVAALLYVGGAWKVWRKAGMGRGLTIAHAAAFAGGWLILVAALVSPLDGLGARLFSAHMLQHELLMVIAAPLFVLSRPLEAWTWGLPAPWRSGPARVVRWAPLRHAWAALVAPLAAWGIHAAALWMWHVPTLFNAALAHEGLHAAQHASFLASALIFWWAVIGRTGERQPALALALLFTTMLHTGALGALLTFSPAPWYRAYDATSAFGFDPLKDQQLGGLIMWIPGGVAYLGAGLAIVFRHYLTASDRALPPRVLPDGQVPGPQRPQ